MLRNEDIKKNDITSTDEVCDDVRKNAIMRMNRRTFIKVAGLTAGALAFSNLKFIRSAMGAVVVQTPLNSTAIPQFVDPLPLLNVVPGGTIRTLPYPTDVSLYMHEFKANILPTGTFLPGVKPETWVWGYLPGTASAPILAQDTYIGPVIVANRGTSIKMTFINNLGRADPNAVTSVGSKVLAYTQSTDQTLHWADPNGGEMNACSMAVLPGLPPTTPCNLNYDGPIPACAHLHGGEVPPVLDGGPDAWFLSQMEAGYTQQGHGYYTSTVPADAGMAPANGAIYRYPNKQEASPIWFHDHTLGATRLNVYAGLAGGYVITDPNLPLPSGLDPIGLKDTVTTALEPIIPIVIQDRMFDINGQLFFPNIGINPEHPFWIPEFLGDVIVVNGKAWPFLNVQPKRYRFLFLNGSNARTYVMDFQIQGKGKSPMFWQIGTDGGYLDAPVGVPQLVLMPGERADVIIDFAGFKPGTTMILANSGKAPYPAGSPPQGTTTGRIMQFRVIGAPAIDNTFNPATPGVTIRGSAGQGAAIVRLPGTPKGPAITTGNVQKTRLLTLNEVMAPRNKVGGIQYPGGPLEILVNNTKYAGHSPRNTTAGVGYQDFTMIGNTHYSELPTEGETEVWEIVNLTADAHPIHLHLVQFQLINRQNFDVKGYTAAYNLAFPGGAIFNPPIIDPATGLPYAVGIYIPGFGPPLNYNTSTPNKLGGNPEIDPLYLLGAPIAPVGTNEEGWKDTVMVPPGMVTRIAVRYTPTDYDPAKGVNSPSPANYPFNPNGDHGFVWHCHIIDHEDNEMMRPYTVIPKAGATRTYNQGTDY